MRTAIIVVVLALCASASVADPEDRVYHRVPIRELATSRHTHVEVEGAVTLVRREGDGDIHIRINDAGRAHFVVAEIIPTLKPAKAFQVPHVGDWVRVRGIRRVDGDHGWNEIHPVEFIEKVDIQ